MLNILFVCTGNTCRSPMAEALFNSKCEKLGLPMRASSAGLAAFSGDPPSVNSVAMMAELGIDISSHRSRRVNAYLLEESDVNVCMTEAQRQMLAFTEKAITPPGGIPDPYGGDIHEYRTCRDALSDFIDSLIETLSRVDVTPMSARDVSAVARLEKECFSVPWSEEAILAELSNETAHFFTAKRFGETVGYIGTHLVLDECYISNIAVTEKERRKGIGSKLLGFAEEFAKQSGAAFISLEVRKSGTVAIALYEKHGFTVCGERKDFYTQPTENGLIMTKFFNEENNYEDTCN